MRIKQSLQFCSGFTRRLRRAHADDEQHVQPLLGFRRKRYTYSHALSDRKLEID